VALSAGIGLIIASFFEPPYIVELMTDLSIKDIKRIEVSSADVYNHVIQALWIHTFRNRDSEGKIVLPTIPSALFVWSNFEKLEKLLPADASTQDLCRIVSEEWKKLQFREGTTLEPPFSAQVGLFTLEDKTE
jgi:hypothetical protein